MDKLEKIDERKFAKYIKAEGCEQRKFSIEKGDPDRIIFAPEGQVLLLEWKKIGKRLEKHQVVKYNTFMDLGFTVHVCHTFAEALEFFYDWLSPDETRSF